VSVPQHHLLPQTLFKALMQGRDPGREQVARHGRDGMEEHRTGRVAETCRGPPSAAQQRANCHQLQGRKLLVGRGKKPPKVLQGTVLRAHVWLVRVPLPTSLTGAPQYFSLSAEGSERSC
jgi:hypothetical protein